VVAVDLSREKRPALVVDAPANPRVAASWKRDICRPRTALAHPDGRHVLMAGYAGYGLCGGGIGIYHLETGKAELLTADEDLLPGHSCITLQALPNGDLVGGTCIAAPGGGHSTATEAELFILDWSTRKLAFHTSIGSRITSIISILVAGDGLVYGLAGDSTFFVFDPGPRKMVHTESMRAYGRPVRHALQAAPDGTLSALFTQSIVRITPGTFAHSKLASPPTPVTAGGALVNGLLCYASGSHVWTYALP